VPHKELPCGLLESDGSELFRGTQTNGYYSFGSLSAALIWSTLTPLVLSPAATFNHHIDRKTYRADFSLEAVAKRRHGQKLPTQLRFSGLRYSQGGTNAVGTATTDAAGTYRFLLMSTGSFTSGPVPCRVVHRLGPILVSAGALSKQTSLPVQAG